MKRSDARDRIVDAAVARLHEDGITVALDGISLETAIADAGVPRATAYRRWPNRTEFLRAVLVRAVRDVRLEPETPGDLRAIRQLLDGLRDELATEAGRCTAAVESLRIATGADHQRLSASREWRDYLALRVTCDGLPDDDLRRTLTAELRETERSFVRQRAAIYARIPQKLGYRLTPPLTGDNGFTVMATSLGALMTGLILTSDAPDQTHTFRARAFGSTKTSDWTTVSYALTAAFLAFLEPDTDAQWDQGEVLALFDDMGA